MNRPSRYSSEMAFRLFQAVAALALLAYGGYLIYPPLVWVLPGALLWADLCVDDLKRGAHGDTD